MRYLLASCSEPPSESRELGARDRPLTGSPNRAELNVNHDSGSKASDRVSVSILALSDVCVCLSIVCRCRARPEIRIGRLAKTCAVCLSSAVATLATLGCQLWKRLKATGGRYKVCTAHSITPDSAQMPCDETFSVLAPRERRGAKRDEGWAFWVSRASRIAVQRKSSSACQSDLTLVSTAEIRIHATASAGAGG